MLKLTQRFIWKKFDLSWTLKIRTKLRNCKRNPWVFSWALALALITFSDLLAFFLVVCWGLDDVGPPLLEDVHLVPPYFLKHKFQKKLLNIFSNICPDTTSFLMFGFSQSNLKPSELAIFWLMVAKTPDVLKLPW